MKFRTFFLMGTLACSLAAGGLRAQLNNTTKQLARNIYKQLIEINTTDSVGSTTVAAEAMARRLRDAGFPASDVQVLGPNARKGNLVARLHGTGARKPILMICHLDVVEARREDWSMDPFQLIEKDGYFYGRGSGDIKDGDAILVTTFIRMKQEGFRPDRDLILALTADEEGGPSNGVDWLIKNHRDLIDAEFILNPDAGDFELDHGKKLLVGIQLSARPEQRDLRTGRGLDAPGTLPISFRTERSDARLFRTRGRHRRRANRRGHEGDSTIAAGRSRHRATFSAALLQRATANHVRGYAARRRPCE